MLPLKTFYHITKTLGIKPFEFWPEEVRCKILKEAKNAVIDLKKILETKNLTKNQAYKTLLNMEDSFVETRINEVNFIQSFSNLLEIYKLASSYEKQKYFYNELEETISKVKPKILEYYIGLEFLHEKTKTMTHEDRNKSDMKIIQQIGIFYILEYTVYILSILPTLTADQRKKLFYEGLQTKEANLPPYTDFADNFRRDLCLKILDADLRNKLLEIFFTFEAVFNEGDLLKIYTAFKVFNIELLKLFKEKGIKNFETVLLSPFGKSVPMGELIKKIEEIKI